MITGTPTPEIHATKIEIQNEIKRTEIKNSDNKCLTSVKNREILEQENAEQHENNAEIINIINVDRVVSNVQEHGINAAVTNVYRMEKGHRHFRKPGHGDPENKNPAIYPRHYWVQAHIQSSMPEGSTALNYDSSRNGFVALVFGVTFIMLVITAVLVGIVYNTDLRRTFRRFNLYFLLISIIGVMMVSYAMTCCTFARVPPCNIIMLVLAVIFMSLLAATITARYKTDMIFLAFIVTAVTVFMCFLLALTRFDFTSWLLYLIGISMAFTVLVLVVSVTSLTTGVWYRPLHLVILVVATILNVIFLIIELQMILGGKSVELSEDDWALGAFMLYTSIVELFLNILRLLDFA